MSAVLCEMPAEPSPYVDSVLPVVAISERKLVGVRHYVRGPLTPMDWRAIPMAMDMEADRFCRRNDAVPARYTGAARWTWALRGMLPVWVIPLAEPVELVAEQITRSDHGLPYLQRLERAVTDDLTAQMRNRGGHFVPDEMRSGVHGASLLWEVRLEVDAYAIPSEARIPADREEFTRVVFSMQRPLDALRWAVPTESHWPGD